MHRGFTLLELSIVLGLIAIIVGGGLVITANSLKTSQYNNTIARMDAIENALLNFAAANNRIPCPSDLTLTPTSTNYGLEAGAGSGSTIGVGTGVCTGVGMLPQANFSTGAAEGGVPTRALDLPDDYMYDGWGRRFRYAADISMTASGALPVQSGKCAAVSVNAITIDDATGATRTTTGIYALLSHGANGHGAYTVNGVTLNAGSLSVDELANCNCTSAGAGTGSYSPTYVEKAPAYDAGHAGSALYNFDDIVTFKEPWQMQAQNFTLGPEAQCIYIADYFNNKIRMVNRSGIITTVAGTGAAGYGGDGGAATSATLNGPYGVEVDSIGNLYITELTNHTVRKVNGAGIITTIAGNGTSGFTGDGGAATSAKLNVPRGVSVDSVGNIYIADGGNNRIRMINPLGIISTIAGTGAAGSTGDGGAATSALLNLPLSANVDNAGNIYIADYLNNRIRVINSSGIINAYAGTGTAGFSGDGGAATSAKLTTPAPPAIDGFGNIYIGDNGNNRVRLVSPLGIISTIAGTGSAGSSGDGGAATSATFNYIVGTAVDAAGNLYIADYNSHRIRMINTSGIINTYAGTGVAGSSGDNGAASSARLNGPLNIAISSR